jgi:hypothetical protein
MFADCPRVDGQQTGASHAGNRGSKPLRGATKISGLDAQPSDSCNFFSRRVVTFSLPSFLRSARLPRRRASSAIRTVVMRTTQTKEAVEPYVRLLQAKEKVGG